MQSQSNATVWFEIAVNDLDRAKKFYGNVFDVQFEDMEMDNSKMAMFPWNQEAPGSSGALYKSDMAKPSAEGTMVYLGCEDCATEVSRVEANGGKVIVPKTSIGEYGFIAQFIDTEGNRVGMHSNS